MFLRALSPVFSAAYGHPQGAGHIPSQPQLSMKTTATSNTIAPEPGDGRNWNIAHGTPPVSTNLNDEVFPLRRSKRGPSSDSPFSPRLSIRSTRSPRRRFNPHILPARHLLSLWHSSPQDRLHPGSRDDLILHPHTSTTPSCRKHRRI